MSDEHRHNGKGGVGRTGASATVGGTPSAGRIWYLLRAYIDELCDAERSLGRVEGLDRPASLRNFAAAVDDSVSTLTHASALARAEAIDLERGKHAPPEEKETSETRRIKRGGAPDSSPGHKRS